MSVFSSNWFSDLVKSRELTPPNCRVNESKSYSAQLLKYIQKYTEQTAVSDTLYICISAQIDIHLGFIYFANDCQKQTEQARIYQILCLKRTGKRMKIMKCDEILQG